jgi:hypothetical protein
VYNGFLLAVNRGGLGIRDSHAGMNWKNHGLCFTGRFETAEKLEQFPGVASPLARRENGRLLARYERVTDLDSTLRAR